MSVRRSNGCIPCKQRRKKCDETKPICRACARNILICSWGFAPHPKPRGIAERNELLRSRPSMPTWSDWCRSGAAKGSESLISLTLNPLHPQLSRPETNFLYAYFHDNAAQSISVRDASANPLIHVLLPMAAVSEVVFQAMLSLSGAVCQQKHSAAFTYATWEHFAQAIRCLKYGLTQFVAGDRRLGPELVASILLLFAFEMYRDDMLETAFVHLRACRALVPMAFAQCTDPRVLSFLAEFYAYHLVLLPTSSLDSADNIAADTKLAFYTLFSNTIPPSGMLFGCAFTLFQAIPEVTIISRRVYDERRATGTITLETLLERQRLHNLVQYWRPVDTDAENIICGQTYQLALLALLSLDEPGPSGNQSQRHFAQCLVNTLNSLPVSSKVSTVLAWPLAHLAPFLDSQEDKDLIQQYLGDMAQLYGQWNFRRIIQLLKLVWSRADLRDRGPYCLPSAMEILGGHFMFC